jgi:hypothetical protein
MLRSNIGGHRKRGFSYFGAFANLHVATMLTNDDIGTIAGVLGQPEALGDAAWLWNIRHAESGRLLACTVTTGADLGAGEPGTMVSAHTQQGYLELHGVTHCLVIEPDEVMFVAQTATALSSLIVGKTCTCSVYANVRPSILRHPITELDPAVLMAAMQMALAESVLEQS